MTAGTEKMGRTSGRTLLKSGSDVSGYRTPDGHRRNAAVVMDRTARPIMIHSREEVVSLDIPVEK